MNYNEFTQQVYEQALEQFVGKDFKSGICSVPHPSGDLNAIRDYIKKVLTSCGITPVQDEYGNMWCDIPASPDCQNWKKIVLQGHMDMVWTLKEGETQVTHPIPVEDVDSDGKPIIHTDGYKSSLGADDGTGVATMLAIITLKDAFKHGTIRCIFTADEEPGLVGASKIGKMASGDYINPVSHDDGWDNLINIDGESEDEIIVSCSGGYSCKYVKPKFKDVAEKTDPEVSRIDPTWAVYQLNINGGQGGHSGYAIKNNLCNTIKLGAEAMIAINEQLVSLDKQLLRIISFDCNETANNVVPKQTVIQFATNTDDDILPDLNAYANSLQTKIKREHPNEKNITVSFQKVDYQAGNEPLALHNDLSLGLMKWIDNSYYGLKSQDPDDGRPISSSNICPVSINLLNEGTEEKPQFMGQFYSRSEDIRDLAWFKNYATENYLFLDRTFQTFEDTIHETNICDYEPYVYNPNDKIRPIILNSYKNLNINYSLSKVHGGIECAWWYKYNNQINQVSIGSTINDVHTPRETLYLNSWKKIISIVLDAIQSMRV